MCLLNERGEEGAAGRMSNASHRDAADAVLQVRSVKKSFGSVTAIKNVSFSIAPGEVMGLVGDNGAGKSTLVKVIAGVHRPDAGTVSIDGREVELSSPELARKAGIETVFQDLALIEIFDVAENMFLGRELSISGPLRLLSVLRYRQMRAEAIKAIAEMGINIPGITSSMISDLSGGQRQAVAIARAVFWRSKILLLDEPTAALGVAETAEVEQLIKKICGTGRIAILIVSHDMPQVARLADKAVVMRQGNHVATLQRPDLNPSELVGYVTGALPPQESLQQKTQ